MDYNVNGLVVERLKDQYQLKTRGQHLREGICPQCDKKSLWSWVATPGVVQCNKVSKCGYNESTKNLFPDLFEDLDKKYPKTKDNPHATADAYLSMVRGFDLEKLRGCYSQNEYYHPHGDRGTTSIRFYLSMKDAVYWERLLDVVTITDPKDGSSETRNMSFKGSFRGMWWQPPGQTIEKGSTVYLTEGIFDCVALWLAGKKACAIMSAGSLPKASLEKFFGLRINWRLALDNDGAGRKYSHKHVKWLLEQGEHAGAIFSSELLSKRDWNDLHQRQQLTSEDFRNYKYYGKLELVKTAHEKAQLMYDHASFKELLFTFSHFKRMYRCTVDIDAHKKMEEELNQADKNSDEIALGAFHVAGKAIQEGNCDINLLHILESEVGEDPLYRVKVCFDNGAPSRQIDLGGNSFSSSAEFKKSIMSKAPGALCTTTAKSLEHRFTRWFKKKPIIVKTLDYAGYNKETDAYIYKEWAVQAGKIIKVNSDGFFELKQFGIKTHVDLKQKLTDKTPVPWLSQYKTAYGDWGLVALTWWVGALFVEQIRQDYRSYPFIEIVGEASSGKTDMVDFLWKLLGREGDSFNPNSSSLAGRTRKMAEGSCVPLVFNETDNETAAQNNHAKKFNWDEWKDLFDGLIGRVLGVKTQDNKTRNTLFRSALCIVQNMSVFASEAILSRIIHLQFDRTHHSQAGKTSSDHLKRLAITDVSGFLLQTNVRSKEFMDQFARQLPLHIKTLQGNDNITLARIIENHAKLMAVADCLPLVMPISVDDVVLIHRQLTKMAEDRQQALREDIPRVQLFWENFNFLNSRFDVSDTHGENTINHHPKPDDYIAVNGREYYELVNSRGMERIETVELHKILPTSVEYEYVSKKIVTSRITGKKLRCWVFKTPGKKFRDLRDAEERKNRRKG